MTTLRLRDAGPGDAGAVAALHTLSWRRHYRGAYADSFLDGDVLSDRQALWSARLASPGHQLTLLAEVGGDIAGFVHVVFDHDRRWGSLVDNLHVTGERQRSGIGTALLAGAGGAVVDRAAGASMYLWVLEQNTAAQRFYRARGGAQVEQARVEPPGGVPSRIVGSPLKLRMAWPDASALLAGGPGV